MKDDINKLEVHVQNGGQLNVALDNGKVYAMQNNGNIEAIKLGNKTSGKYDINETISYKWVFGWSVEGMPNPKPIVNRLIKAIIEGDVSEMEFLYKKGASLKKTDTDTFQRVLFHVISKYDTIKWLVNHGMTSENTVNCIGVDGYIWGLLARAWYVKAYDVMEILAYYGFYRLCYCINGKAWDALELIFQKDDIQAMKILKEHGFIEDVDYLYGYPYPILRRKYPQSKVTLYLEEHPIIKRKSVGLDNFKFRTIPEPNLEKEGVFFKKNIKERNKLKIADYEDRIRAQKEYLNVFHGKY